MRISVKIVSPFMELSKRFDTEKQAEKWLETQKKIHDLSVEREIAKYLKEQYGYVSQRDITAHLLCTGSRNYPMTVNIIDTQYTLELN